MSMWGKFSNITDNLLGDNDEINDDLLHPLDQELKQTRDQLVNLNGILTTTKNELNHYKTTYNEVSERLQASEIQNQEYQRLLSEKENEIFLLKSSKFNSPKKSLMVNGSNGSSSLSSFLDTNSQDDQIDNERKIQQLMAVLDEVRGENEMLKKMFSENNHPSVNVDEIIELAKKLEDETIKHQQEISALQFIHQMKIDELKNEKKLTESESPNEGENEQSLKIRVSELEREMETLWIETSELRNQLNKEKKLVEKLQDQKKSMKEERDSVASLLKDFYLLDGNSHHEITTSESPPAHSHSKMNGEMENGSKGNHNNNEGLIESVQKLVDLYKMQKELIQSQQIPPINIPQDNHATVLPHKEQEQSELISRQNIEISELKEKIRKLEDIEKSHSSEESEGPSHFVKPIPLPPNTLANVSTPNTPRIPQTPNSNNDEVTQLRSSLSKAQKDLVRLREHLMELEEQHTAIDIENAEKVSLLENKIARMTEEHNKYFNIISQFEQLKLMFKEKEDDLVRSNIALTNLQCVLEQFQAEQDLALQNGLSSLQRELQVCNSTIEKLKAELQSLKDIAKKLQLAEQTIGELQSELTAKTRAYILLQEDIEPLRRSFDQTLIRLNDISKNEQHSIDKRVVSSLIVSYFTKGRSGGDVLELMAKILNFTEEQKVQVGISSTRSWIPFFGGKKTTDSQKSSPSDKSITDLWIDFLLKEAEKATHPEAETETHEKAQEKKIQEPNPTKDQTAFNFNNNNYNNNNNITISPTLNSPSLQSTPKVPLLSINKVPNNNTPISPRNTIYIDPGIAKHQPT